MAHVHIAIADGPLEDSRPALAEGAGAVITFLGIVRSDESGAPIEGLDYTAYEPMASRVLEHLAREAVSRFGVLAAHVEHSRGFVSTGACSFRLTIAGAHRREALDAMDWFIERMKQDAPIWKRAVSAPIAAPALGTVQQ